VSSSDPKDFHVDMTFTGQDNRLIKPIAIAIAAVSIVFIIATMTTNVAASFLPMSDEYLQVLVPRAQDGKEPLALQTLDQTTTDNTLTVSGTILNRTEYPISGLVVVLEGQDVNYAKQRAEAPVTLPEIPSQQTAPFQVSATFGAQPSAYSVTFRIADGPAVPHRDDRAANFGVGITVQPTTPAPGTTPPTPPKK
jgi:hypothetical protein